MTPSPEQMAKIRSYAVDLMPFNKMLDLSQLDYDANTVKAITGS